jgi:1-deoxy-D-xylulose-5-phosphate reductoisomerase
MKRIVILGSTGSVGRNVLDVARRHPGQFRVVGLAAHRNVDVLRAQCLDHPEARFVVTDPAAAAAIPRDAPLRRRFVGGDEAALVELARASGADLVVNALVGFVGLAPTLAALEAGVPVAIANKESIVAGGELLLGAARRSGVHLVPIDSEHVAIAQCLAGASLDHVERVTLTASGGALRDRSPDAVEAVSVRDVLAHPTWRMGAKITVDSATLVNKGLEVIEAHWLFGLPYEKIDVVVHPQSIVHSIVRFVDGSMIAQMATPDMRIPILYALAYPDRLKSDLGADLLAFPALSFAPVDDRKYPCFRLALAAARAGGTAPTVLNAANEVAVEAFLRGALPFSSVPDVLASALDALPVRPVAALDDVVQADREARRWVNEHHRAAAAGDGR